MNFSVPTLDPEVWRTTEPGTAPPRQRLRALSALVDAGIKAGVGMAPILPGISDRPELLADVVRAAREAGATDVWCNVLYLQPGTREHFLEQLARDWPEELDALRAALREERLSRPARGRSVREQVRFLARGTASRPAPRRLTPPRNPSTDDVSQSEIRLPQYTCAAMPEEITCLIVDDHEVVREGLRLSLSRAPHIRVIGEASDGAGAVALVDAGGPRS